MGVYLGTRSKTTSSAIQSNVAEESQDLWTAGLPIEIYTYIFSEFDFHFEDLLAASLTCHHWNAIVRHDRIGRRLFAKANIFPPNENNETWMKTYSVWVHQANYYLLLDVSLSMEQFLPNGVSRLEMGVEKVREVAVNQLHLAKNGLNLSAFSTTFNEFHVESEKNIRSFFDKKIGDVPRSGTRVGDILSRIRTRTRVNNRKTATLGPVTHIHVFSDFDFHLWDFSSTFIDREPLFPRTHFKFYKMGDVKHETFSHVVRGFNGTKVQYTIDNEEAPAPVRKKMRLT